MNENDYDRDAILANRIHEMVFHCRGSISTIKLCADLMQLIIDNMDDTLAQDKDAQRLYKMSIRLLDSSKRISDTLENFRDEARIILKKNV